MKYFLLILAFLFLILSLSAKNDSVTIYETVYFSRDCPDSSWRIDHVDDDSVTFYCTYEEQ